MDISSSSKNLIRLINERITTDKSSSVQTRNSNKHLLLYFVSIRALLARVNF